MMSATKIVSSGTGDTAPIFMSEDGSVPKWCGKRDAVLSNADIEAITKFCMTDAFSRGLEEGALLSNPFNQRFINGVPAMIYATYLMRGEQESCGWWKRPSVEISTTQTFGVDNGQLLSLQS